ncbi:DUF1349 domain-containing protein [Methylobacter sp. BBA5.1]|uniref:beta-xylosidase family glycoside hydrolase n=1 Tax=Methylobacter sp. BBA5.1 TaxID=1495064 RepID=UPI0006904CCE|nr:DUF1349 domain-containing protein [Methylobacter sp. BBA5.1]
MMALYKTVLVILLFFILGTQQQLLADEHYDFVYPNRASLLAAGWDFTAKTSSGDERNTEQTTGAVVSYDQSSHPGILRIPADVGDLWSNLNNSRNTLFRDLPPDWTSITLNLSFAPTDNYQQAGLLLYQDDDNYIQVTRIYNGGNHFEFVYESDGVGVVDSAAGTSATSNLYLRLSRGNDSFIGEYSIGGSAWTELGRIAQRLKNPRLAIFVGASPFGFPNADLASVHITTGIVPGPDLSLFPRDIVFNTTAGSANPSSQSINVLSRGLEDFDWNATPEAPWLAASPLNGSTPGTMDVSVNASGLSPGVYSSTVTVSAETAGNSPQQVGVDLIVNPSTPVSVSPWKDGYRSALSASTDDSQTSCYNTELTNSMEGGFYIQGLDNQSPAPPENVLFSTIYSNNMELGSHTVNHICAPVSEENLRNQEWIPSIESICGLIGGGPLCSQITTFAWPCGFTDVYEQDISSEYFLASRGYNINELEDQTPSNFHNLKSFNSHEHTPYPPSDLKTVIDMAVQQEKWANLVLHNSCNDDDAIAYAVTKDIWGAPVDAVIKYILQRDRFVLNNYQETEGKTTFDFYRLPIPQTEVRTFDDSFGPNDVITLKVDIDDTRTVSSVLINGANTSFFIKTINGNDILFFNTAIDINPKAAEINYGAVGPNPTIGVSPGSLSFAATEGSNPANQTLAITNAGGGTLNWTASADGAAPAWLAVSPTSGTGDGTLTVSVNSASLAPGTYTKAITIAAEGATNTPQTVNVTLTVSPADNPTIGVSPGSLSFTATAGSNPANQTLAITNAGGGTLNWTASADGSAPAWLAVSPTSGTGAGTLTVSVNSASLAPGTYTKAITIAAEGATNTPRTVNVTLTVSPSGTVHDDFTYPDRTSLLADGWNFLARTSTGGTRNTEQTSGAVVSYDQTAHSGVIRIPVDTGDVWEDANDTRNSLFRNLPANWTSIRLKLQSFSPTQDYQQAGLLAYQDDDNYVQVTRIYNGGNRINFAHELNGSPTDLNSVSVSATSNLHFRLDRNPATGNISGYYSLDGANWTSLGSVVQTLNNPRFAIVTGASPGGFPNADIAWTEVITSAESNPTIGVSPESLSFTATAGSNPANQTLAITNAGGGTLNWTASADGSAPAWLAVSPTSGTGAGTPTVSVNSASLAPGTYTKAITIAAEGATNTPRTVNVTLTVSPSGTVHDDFTYPDRTSLLADGWNFLARTSTGGTRNTEQTSGAVVSYDQTAHPGVIRIPVDAGDVWEDTNDTRNSLFRNLPANWTSIRLKLQSFSPTQDYQQAGLLAYQDDDNYVQVTRIYNGGNRVTFAHELNGSANVPNSVSVSATSNLHFRLDRNPATGDINGYYSLDGANWTSLGSVVQTLNNPRFAIVTGASPGGFPNADIAWTEVITSAESNPTMTPQSIAVTPANPTIQVGATQQFIATGTYPDSSTEDLTDNVTWDSSNTATATIDQSGVATGHDAGESTISATLDGVTGSTVLTVQSANIFVGPTANAPVINHGDGNGFQTNPANAHGDDGLFAVDTNSGTNSNTSCTNAGKDKHIYYNYGLNIPSGATIAGIEVRLDARVDATSGSPRMCVQLSWDGGATWTAAKVTPTLSGSEATYILGGTADNWGRSWASSNLSNANFRVRVANVASNTRRDFSLDWVAVRVTY